MVEPVRVTGLCVASRSTFPWRPWLTFAPARRNRLRAAGRFRSKALRCANCAGDALRKCRRPAVSVCEPLCFLRWNPSVSSFFSVCKISVTSRMMSRIIAVWWGRWSVSSQRWMSAVLATPPVLDRAGGDVILPSVDSFHVAPSGITLQELINRSKMRSQMPSAWTHSRNL